LSATFWPDVMEIINGMAVRLTELEQLGSVNTGPISSAGTSPISSAGAAGSPAQSVMQQRQQRQAAALRTQAPALTQEEQAIADHVRAQIAGTS